MKKTVLLSMLLLSFTSAAATDMLPAWKDTPAKQAIEQWVQGATREGGADFIPLDKRYVVFDNDGTLWPEAPLTFQLQFAVDEVKRLAPDHPEWKKDPLVAAVLNNDLKTVAAGGEKGLLKLLALTHSGMTTEEFSQRVSAWFDSHQDKRTGCRYDQLGYQPMRQLLDYLRANGFKTWIVSGGGIDFMRVVSEKMYDIPPEQVIGSFALSEFSLTDDGTELRKTMKGHLMMMPRPSRWRSTCLWGSARLRLSATAMAIWRCCSTPLPTQTIKPSSCWYTIPMRRGSMPTTAILPPAASW